MNADQRGFEASAKEALRPLLGLRLATAHNAGNMKMFHFGELHRIGEQGLVGKYALHVSCPWRIEQGATIVTGFQDFFERADSNADDAWEPGEITGHLQDEILGRLFGSFDSQAKAFVNATDQLTVDQVSADRFGGARVRLTGGYELVLFPDGSRDEQWRLFEVGSESPHFVVDFTPDLEE